MEHIALVIAHWSDSEMSHLARMDGPLDPGAYVTDAKAPSFGKWFLEQAGRVGFIGQCAVIAKPDRSVPRNGGADAAGKRTTAELGGVTL